jgi:hypothetical protein
MRLSLCPLFDARQLMAPEALEDLRPLMERPDRLDVGAIEHLAPVAPHVNQANVAAHPEVLGDRRLSQAQRRDDVADWPFAGREVDKNVAPARLGYGVKDIRAGGCTRHAAITEYVNWSAASLVTPARQAPDMATLRCLLTGY